MQWQFTTIWRLLSATEHMCMTIVKMLQKKENIVCGFLLSGEVKCLEFAKWVLIFSYNIKNTIFKAAVNVGR